jgi:hypothetical protein
MVKAATTGGQWQNATRFLTSFKEEKEHCMWYCWKESACPLDCEAVLLEDNLAPCCAHVMWSQCYKDCEFKYKIQEHLEAAIKLEPRFIDCE